MQDYSDGNCVNRLKQSQTRYQSQTRSSQEFTLAAFGAVGFDAG